jgi:SPFH domain / Band 7 family
MTGDGTAGATAAMPAGEGAPVPAAPVPAEVTEFAVATLPGWPVAWAALATAIAGIALAAVGFALEIPPSAVVGLLLILAALGAGAGLTAVAPGEARVVQLLGRYVGAIRAQGLQWVSPLTRRHRISTRIRNHETGVAKVNDADGNPIEIAAVVVWLVADTGKALFGVDSFTSFVAIQTETAVRRVAGSYPYDAHGDGKLSLRENAEEITAGLAAEIADRVWPAGVQVKEARLPGFRTRPRSRPRCCAASRPARWWRPASGSSTVRSAWWRPPWTGCPPTAWWNSIPSARRPWSAT